MILMMIIRIYNNKIIKRNKENTHNNNNNHKNLPMYNHKIKTDYNFSYLKNHVKMIIINNFILNKNNISK